MTFFSRNFIQMIFLGGLLLSQNTFAFNLCEQKICPKGRKPVQLCFYDSVYANDVWKGIHDGALTVPLSCGLMKPIKADSITEVTARLQQAVDQCESVELMRFIGHGYDGYQFAGDLNDETVPQLKPYSCLMNSKSEVQLRSCHVGQGCEGEHLMFQMAKNIFPNGGTISANIWYWYPGAEHLPILKNLLGAKKILNYTPREFLKSGWQLNAKSPMYGPTGNLTQTCRQELTQELQKMKQRQESKLPSQCTHHPSLSEPRMKMIQHQLNQLTQTPYWVEDLSSDNWEDLSDSLRMIRNQNKFFEDCEK